MTLADATPVPHLAHRDLQCDHGTLRILGHPELEDEDLATKMDHPIGAPMA